MFAAPLAAVLIAKSQPPIAVRVPGRPATFEIKKPGRYSLWSDVEASLAGTLATFPSGLPSDVSIAINRVSDGVVIPLESQWPTTRQHSRTAIRVRIGSVTFPTSGMYSLSTEGLAEARALSFDTMNLSILGMALPGVIGQLLFVVGIVWTVKVARNR